MLDIGGGSLLLNVAEAVIVRRDHCPSLDVVDVRDRHGPRPDEAGSPPLRHPDDWVMSVGSC